MKRLVLVLTGGLGNQLFQIQFLKNIQSQTNCQIYLDITLGKPRGENGIPDAFEFGVPCQVLDTEYSPIASKSIGFLLRSGYSPRKFEENILVKLLVRIAVSAILSIHFKKILIASTPQDIGYDSNFRPSNRNVVTMGYFQSFKYLEKLPRKSSFQSIPDSDRINYYKEKAEIEKPIIVHVRRGDYSLEETFGLLGIQYYERAIDEIAKITKSEKIWLFSDEPQIALTLLPKTLRGNVRIIEEVDSSPAKTLEVMRLGVGYVLANSTFSWWAAQSAYKENAPVAAPAKWFKILGSPIDIIPESWIEIEPYFQ